MRWADEQHMDYHNTVPHSEALRGVWISPQNSLKVVSKSLRKTHNVTAPKSQLK